MAKGAYFYANGKRKNAIATIRLYAEGTGEVNVNGNKLSDWSDTQEISYTVLQPLNLLAIKKDVDVEIVTRGGGKKSQAEAIRLGIARAMEKKDPSFREQLKSEGYLTRDARVKERKKPGLKRARKSPQWSKR
jgi:small subunit ribosomal protein S9